MQSSRPEEPPPPPVSAAQSWVSGGWEEGGGVLLPRRSCVCAGVRVGDATSPLYEVQRGSSSAFMPLTSAALDTLKIYESHRDTVVWEQVSTQTLDPQILVYDSCGALSAAAPLPSRSTQVHRCRYNAVKAQMDELSDWDIRPRLNDSITVDVISP